MAELVNQGLVEVSVHFCRTENTSLNIYTASYLKKNRETIRRAKNISLISNKRKTTNEQRRYLKTERALIKATGKTHGINHLLEHKRD